MAVLIPIVVIAVITGIVIPLVLRHQRRVKERAQAVAASAGLHLDTEGKGPPAIGFDLFQRGRSKRVSFHMWTPSGNDSVFRYQYTTGSGKNSTTHRFTCTIVELPFNAPHLEIGPEGFWSKFGRVLGKRDVEVESPEFNELYKVDSDDERFAITLLDHRMIAWMLSPHSGRGSIRFEFLGNALLCVTANRLDLEEFPGMLGWSQSIRQHLPEVLTQLYPTRR